jgi:hypothetical protein
VLKDGFLKISMHYISMNSKAQTKEDVRLIRGPQLEVLVPRGRCLPFDEALRVAEQGRRVIASNARMNKALVGSEEWQRISDVFACWTGTMTAYAKPEERLGATIEYTDPETKQRWVFPVPKQFQGMRDVILVAEHPDYTLEKDGKNLVVQAGAVDAVENFPARTECWYVADAKHGIPQGEQTNGSTSDQRMLWRIDSRVGPVRRGCDYGRLGGNYGRNVVLDGRPSYGFGVAMEAPEGGRAGDAPQKLQVEAAPEQKGVLITGVSTEQFGQMLADAKAELAKLALTVRDESLQALSRLVNTLQIKE